MLSQGYANTICNVHSSVMRSHAMKIRFIHCGQRSPLSVLLSVLFTSHQHHHPPPSVLYPLLWQHHVAVFTIWNMQTCLDEFRFVVSTRFYFVVELSGKYWVNGVMDVPTEKCSCYKFQTFVITYKIHTLHYNMHVCS